MTEKTTTQITILKNGLRITTDYMPEVESVSFAVWVNTGSRDENKQNNGIAHFLEHMAFKGTKTRTYKDIAEEFDNIGGHYNAFTSEEETVYHAKTLKNTLEKSIEIIADILQNSIFDQEEMEKERQVILQELAMYEDMPREHVSELFQKTAFPNQAYGRGVGGTTKSVKALTRENLINYITKQYKTQNIVISAAGKIDHNNLVNLVKKHFNKLNTGIKNPVETAIYKGGDIRKQKTQLEQTQVILGFEGLNYTDPNYYTLKLMSSILGQGMSSRLFQEIREKRGLAYTITSGCHSTIDTGIFEIYAATSAEKVNELLDATTNEMYKLAEKIKPQELEKILVQAKSSLLMARENTTYRSNKIAEDLLIHNRIKTLDEILEKIQAVTIKDMQNIMQKILTTKPTLACLGNDISKIYSYEELLKKLIK